MGGEAAFPRRVYKNPPIVEAVCSFTFASDSPWNLTVPGRVYEQVRDQYPDEPEERAFMQASIRTGADPGAGEFSLAPSSSRVAFKNGPKTLSIAPRNFSVHSLAPYEGWESFRGRAIAGLQAYRNVVGDAQIAEIGLRYVNRILLPESKISFIDYFTIMQGLPADGFPGGITSFFDRMEVRYPDAPVRITFTWASDDQVVDKAAFIMDFDLARQGEVSPDSVSEYLDDLRERERAAFESLIQDKLRGIFDADD